MQLMDRWHSWKGTCGGKGDLEQSQGMLLDDDGRLRRLMTLKSPCVFKHGNLGQTTWPIVQCLHMNMLGLGFGFRYSRWDAWL